MPKIIKKYIDLRLDQVIYQYKKYSKTIQYDYLGHYNKISFKRPQAQKNKLNIFKCINYYNNNIYSIAYKNVVIYYNKGQMFKKIIAGDFRTALILSCGISYTAKIKDFLTIYYDSQQKVIHKLYNCPLNKRRFLYKYYILNTLLYKLNYI